MNMFPNLSIWKKHRDNLGHYYEAEESLDGVFQPPYRSSCRNIPWVSGSHSHMQCACACDLLVLHSSWYILRHVKEKRATGYHYPGFKCETYDQHGMTVFLVAVDPCKLYLSQIEVQILIFTQPVCCVNSLSSEKTADDSLCIDPTGTGMSSIILATADKVLRDSFKFGSVDRFARDYRPTTGLHSMHFRGLPSLGLIPFPAPVSFLLTRLAIPYFGLLSFSLKPSTYLLHAPPVMRVAERRSSVVVVVVEEERERKVDWSSIPVLVVWMIKDRLDIFDNKRLAVVCRDWWSASNCYPKVLQSVGDGLPWICGVVCRSSGWEFVSVERGGRRFEVCMPECCVNGRVLFSKRGWILMLLRKSGGTSPDSVFLVNLFTRDKIELPPLGPRKEEGLCDTGCFTTSSDGYPQRVFLQVFKGGHSTAVIKTTCPVGDKEWTNYTCLGERGTSTFFTTNDFITIGHYVYWLDGKFRVMALNMADHSWKELPPPPPSSTDDDDGSPPLGFIVEHEGELIFVKHDYDREENSRCRFSSFTLYRYYEENAAALWKRVSVEEVAVKGDTRWFYHARHGCIASTKANGKGGLKIYHLIQYLSLVDDSNPRRHCFRTRVEVYDLLTGNRDILPVPFQTNYLTRWVDIA